MAETQSTTTTTTTEATAPTGDIKVFIDAFNKDFDAHLKSLLDAQQNYKNVYADAIKITTPKNGPWPNDPNVVTIGDLFRYTFPDIESDKIIEPPEWRIGDGPESDKLINSQGWLNDLKNSKDEKIKKMYSTISSGIRSTKDMKKYQDLKKPGITNPSLWSPGQYYFDVFMEKFFVSRETKPSSFLKDPYQSNIDDSTKNDYVEFADAIYSLSNIVVYTTGINISLKGNEDKSSFFPSLQTQYKSGLWSELVPKKNVDDQFYKDKDFDSRRGDFDSGLPKTFIGYHEHIFLYKAFIQAGDNYKSVVLPRESPEAPTTTPDSNPPLVKVQKPQEVGYTFNVEKKDSFVIVGGSMSGMEFTIVPNDGTTYITNESPINNLDDEDMLSDEYSEGEFIGIEDSSTKVEYSPTIDDKQAVVTDTATLSGPVEITKPKDGSMTISADGLKRLKKHEGSRATVYDDKTGKGVSSWGEVAGFPTIGVGHLIQNNEKTAFSKFLKPGKMSDNEIDNLLLKDLQERINALNKKLKVKVSQNQFDSLLSMMFNTGGANKSFLKAISLTNEGKFKDAAAQIKSGPKSSKGVILAGLERRRNEEAETYLA